MRKQTKTVQIGGIAIGGSQPIAIQSMTNTDTSDWEATVGQTQALHKAGAGIVRVAWERESHKDTFARLLALPKVAIVADIQFDYRLAVLASELGVPKIRFNPGNVGGEGNIKKILDACKANGTTIRIGVNSGSVSKQHLQKAKGDKGVALAESLLDTLAMVEKVGFDKIVLGLKSSDVVTNLTANRVIASQTDYPLHIGVTESGVGEIALAKSFAGLGALLLDGIGDTIRISLTGDPMQEVLAAQNLLRAIGVDNNFANVISCPTCSRCKYSMSALVDKVQAMTQQCVMPLTIAVMGCVVNGPGEASDADLGIAGGGDNKAVVFEHGEVTYTGDSQTAEKLFLQKIQQRIAGIT
ncbi:MAG: flavodoxin-dependent (E)-4-hydroxy-3-methylbut-2-enyl-diphosphate synthase [Firmicutes bacterium]|nr:flavodoxin-dependent (E)-4-hydroxy-3-methylbut-2-enyl-diphosphate synthase [Bacillota bacterium]